MPRMNFRGLGTAVVGVGESGTSHLKVLCCGQYSSVELRVMSRVVQQQSIDIIFYLYDTNTSVKNFRPYRQSISDEYIQSPNNAHQIAQMSLAI